MKTSVRARDLISWASRTRRDYREPLKQLITDLIWSARIETNCRAVQSRRPSEIMKRLQLSLSAGTLPVGYCSAVCNRPNLPNTLRTLMKLNKWKTAAANPQRYVTMILKNGREVSLCRHIIGLLRQARMEWYSYVDCRTYKSGDKLSIRWPTSLPALSRRGTPYHSTQLDSIATETILERSNFSIASTFAKYI